MPEVQKSANGSVFHSALCKIGQLPNLRGKSGTLDLPYFAGCANHPPTPQVPAVKECPPDTLLSPGRASLEYRERKQSTHNGNSARSCHTTKLLCRMTGAMPPRDPQDPFFLLELIILRGQSLPIKLRGHHCPERMELWRTKRISRPRK